MPDVYVISEMYKQDKTIIIAFSQFAAKLAAKLENPALAPVIVKILWERRNEFELLNTTSFDSLLNGK